MSEHKPMTTEEIEAIRDGWRDHIDGVGYTPTHPDIKRLLDEVARLKDVNLQLFDDRVRSVDLLAQVVRERDQARADMAELLDEVERLKADQKQGCRDYQELRDHCDDKHNELCKVRADLAELLDAVDDYLNELSPDDCRLTLIVRRHRPEGGER